MTPLLPLVVELDSSFTVPQALTAMAGCRNVLLFDSSLARSPLGRYSFLMADPIEVIQLDRGEYGQNPFAQIALQLEKYRSPARPDLPPFQGGAAGLLSYDLGHCFEQLPEPTRDEFQIPAAVMGLYAWVLAWDHQEHRCWFIAQGYPEVAPDNRLSRAQQDWERIRRLLDQKPQPIPSMRCSSDFPSGSSLPQFKDGSKPSLDKPLPLLSELQSNFTEAEYLCAVRKVVDHITAGDIFQANLSQRLLFPARTEPISQYLRLREQNPAPFAGFFAHEDWAILCSSPERFLQLQDRTVFTRPIKGTRQRGLLPEADLYTRDELRESEKDRAENIMIVDLLRNDLSRVCLPGSIQVSELCSVEAYETVSHLVSEVRGILRPDASFWDLLAAAFPGGSITGAPKIRAMEIITELEQVARGPYCGSLFYHGFDGTADSNILIRTMVQRGNWLTFSAGGGIVVLSDPRTEYEETLHKARGMLNALKD